MTGNSQPVRVTAPAAHCMRCIISRMRKSTKFYAKRELRRAVNELKLTGRRQYEIARTAGFSTASPLTDILNAARPGYPDDPRIQALCRLVNLSFEQAFDEVVVEPQPLEQSA